MGVSVGERRGGRRGAGDRCLLAHGDRKDGAKYQYVQHRYDWRTLSSVRHRENSWHGPASRVLAASGEDGDLRRALPCDGRIVLPYGELAQLPRRSGELAGAREDVSRDRGST